MLIRVCAVPLAEYLTILIINQLEILFIAVSAGLQTLGDVFDTFAVGFVLADFSDEDGVFLLQQGLFLGVAPVADR